MADTHLQHKAISEDSETLDCCSGHVNGVSTRIKIHFVITPKHIYRLVPEKCWVTRGGTLRRLTVRRSDKTNSEGALLPLKERKQRKEEEKTGEKNKREEKEEEQSEKSCENMSSRKIEFVKQIQSFNNITRTHTIHTVYARAKIQSLIIVDTSCAFSLCNWYQCKNTLAIYLFITCWTLRIFPFLWALSVCLSGERRLVFASFFPSCVFICYIIHIFCAVDICSQYPSPSLAYTNKRRKFCSEKKVNICKRLQRNAF